MTTTKRPQVCVIGGGTGTAVVLSGLKKYPLDLHAIISMADSGGSTGRLRDEFGFLPVGDLRQACAALSSDKNDGLIAKLLLYRFSPNSSLDNHNLGNLIFTALQDMTQSTSNAISAISKLFHLQGKIYPVTEDDIQLVIHYQDGTTEIGEATLDEKHGGKKISSISTTPKAKLNPAVAAVIQQADYIIIGPGDLYGSLLPNLIIDGMKAAFKKTTAPIIFIQNLMTHYTQTHNMTALDHVQTIEQTIGKKVNHIIINNGKISQNLLNKYEQQHEFPVVDNISNHDSRVIQANLISITPVIQSKDSVKRSYLRHDSDKLAKEVMSIMETNRKGKKS